MSINELNALDLIDLEEPPSTDPSPGVGGAALSRVDNPEDDLETRLAWLAAEVRSTSAEHAKKKREESILEAREYKTAIVPVATRTPVDIGLPKISIAAGVLPQTEPTRVGRRLVDNEWELDTSDPEELSRTLPLDPNAAIADPLPFHQETTAQKRPNRSKFVMAIFAFGLILLGSFLQRSWTNSIVLARYAAIPEARVIASVIEKWTEHYYEGWLAELAHRTQEKDVRIEVPGPMSVGSAPAPIVTANNANNVNNAKKKYNSFPYVKPLHSSPSGATSGARQLDPTKPQPNIYKDLGF